MARSVTPLYLKITNPRDTNSGTSLPSAQSLFKGLSVSSHYKVSLGLQRLGVPYAKESQSLEDHLTACGVFDEYESSNFNYDFFASEAMLPGANFDITEQPGAYQGMLEYNATRRIFPDFEVTFYVDDKYNIIRIFEEWMNFINPLYTSYGKYTGGWEGQTENDFDTPAQPYYRMQYPKNYKREINITKFERNLYKNLNDNNLTDSQWGYNPQHILSYKFIDAFPKQVTAIPVTYEGSTLTRLTVIFGYTRYITIKDNGPEPSSAYGSKDNVSVMDAATRKARQNYGKSTLGKGNPLNEVDNTYGTGIPSGSDLKPGSFSVTNHPNSAKKLINAQLHLDEAKYGTTVPEGSFSISKKVKKEIDLHNKKKYNVKKVTNKKIPFLPNIK